MATSTTDIIDTQDDSIQDHPAASAEQDILDRLAKGIDYYKKRNNTLTMIILVLVSLSLAEFAMISYLILNQPIPQYFAQKPDLTITPLIPLNEPYLLDDAVAQWAADCTRHTFSLDFIHLAEDLANARTCYQDTAFQELLTVMQTEGIFNLIKQEHLNTEMSITTPAIVTKSGVVNGVMAWIIEFKFILSFLSSEGLANTQKMLTQVVVQRADTRDYPKGVVIRQIIAKPD